MRIIMEKNEVIGKEEIKAVLDQLAAAGLSKGAAIRALFAGGLSVKENSDMTTIRYNHVYNVCRSEVLKNRMETDVTTDRETGTKKQQILDLLATGKTVTEVSKELGCLYNQVWQIAKGEGYTKKQQLSVVEG